ncbi:MAG: NAD(P)H-dependent oxidoreductase subunit E [Pseudomonadota bacterium]|nr:NAD(P)H-dependent oxidoreductase subunit E [Pseudomonadota bacterium]
MSSQNRDHMDADELSEHVRQEVDKWLKHYPDDRKQSAVLAALRAVQHESGYLSTESMKAVAAYLGLPDIAVFEVASFYSMFNVEPVGRHEISVCTNVSCMLRGADEIVAHLEGRLGVKLGGSTPDGKFFLKREEECLAACCGAPMMQINHVYHEDLTPERVDQLLDELD